MKILLAANDSYGLYLFRRDLIRRLIEDGHEVFAAFPDGPCTERIRALGAQFIDTPIDRRGVSVRSDSVLLHTYEQLLHRIRPDLIVTYTIKPNIYCGLAAKRQGIPYAINITGLGTAFQKPGPLQSFVRLLYRTGCDRARTVFTENSGITKQLLAMHLFRSEQICTLPGAGVNLTEYAFTPYPEVQQPLRFLFVGRVMREKGVDELLTAAQRLIADGVSVQFHIAGIYEDDYRDRINALAQAGVVTYHGFLDDVRPLIAASHCLVLPSWHEGMSNVLLEAGAMGRPLITSRIHGCMEGVREGETGFLCTPRDAESLYEAMRRFVELPYTEKVRMGAASFAYIAEKFDKQRVVDATVARLY